MCSLLNILLKKRSPIVLLKEFIILLWGYPLYVFSFLVPRAKNKWVFGNSIGFVGNTKYLYLFLQEKKNIQSYWITSNTALVKELRTLSLPVYYTYSLKGLYHSLTSKVYIFADRSKEINFWCSGNALKINLWHGVGVKSLSSGKFKLDNGSLLSRFLFPYRYEKFTCFLSTSKLMNEHFVREMNLSPDVVFEGLYPRCSFIISPHSVILGHIKKYEKYNVEQFIGQLQKYSRVFLYMPTWRHDLKGDFLREAGFDLCRLNNILESTNQCFIFKLHASVQVDLSEIDAYSNILFLDNKLDVYPILPFTDVLITDYSSIYYDYLLMENKGILLFPFDLELYENEDFKLALDFEHYTPGLRVYKFEDLLGVVSDMNLSFCVSQRDRVINEFWGDYRKYSMEQIYTKMQSLIISQGQ